MTKAPVRAWQPNRHWADPLIALLAVLALLIAGYTLRVRQKSAQRPSERVSLQGRVTEVALAGTGLVPGGRGRILDWARVEAQLKEPWDRAMLALLKTELSRRDGRALPGHHQEGRRGREAPGRSPLVHVSDKHPIDSALEAAAPAGTPSDSFRRACLAAYQGAPLPGRAERAELHRRLGGGYTADLLEARLLDQEGAGYETLRTHDAAPRTSAGEALRARAQGDLMLQLAGLGLLGVLVVAMAVGGLTLAIYLLATRSQPRPALPPWSMSGRAAAIVLLAWFLAFFLSGNLALLMLQPWPALRWLTMPMNYLLHAAFGIGLLCRAEGLSLRELWLRMAPGRRGHDLAWGAGFLALAWFLVLGVSLASSALWRPEQNPQRDLQELLRSLSGWGPNLALFLTVAGLAPLFEELLFRGFLLPLLAQRGPLVLAVVASALLFGAIHLQPAGLPVFCTLGLALGLAMRQTGSLRTPILVHACWNGGLFLLMRAFA